MATDTHKSESQTPELENPNKTLTLDPPNLNHVSESPSPTEDYHPDPQSESAPEKDDVHDGSKPKAEVLSPRGDTGSANDIQKKVRRAERFGVPVQLSEKEKRNSRAERFGTAAVTNTASEATKSAEELKRKARAERFGLSVPADEEAKKKARNAKFGTEVKVDSQEEEKRKARALRFSQSSANDVSEISSKGIIEPKVAIAGDTNGGA